MRVPQATATPEWITRAMDHASCGITIADATQNDMPLIYVNRAFETMTGYTREEILGRNCRFLQGPERDQPELAGVRQALAEHRQVMVVLRNYRKDGKVFWNELRLAPVFGSDGRLTHYVGIQTDITAQKQAEAEVQRQSQRFIASLDAMPFGILVLDVTGRVFFANHAANAISGRTFEPGMQLPDVAKCCQFAVADSGRPYPHAAIPIMRALAGESVTVDDIAIQRDDRLIPLQVCASPLRDPRGDVSDVVVVFTDMSEIREKERKLKEEEARHRALLNSSLDAVITMDAASLIQSINPAAERMFGYRPEELLGRDVRLLMPEPHHNQHSRHLTEYPKIHHAKTIGIVREMSARRKDGSLLPVEVAVTEVKLSQGSLFKGIVRDISKRKAAQELAARTMTELKKSQDNLLVLLNQFRVGTLILDADHRVEFVSKSCEQFANIDRAAAIGQRWDQVLPFGTHSRLQLQHLLKLPPTERQRITLHWQDSGQQEHWLECDVRNAPQDHQRHILLLYDVTEVHRLRQAMEESRYGKMLGDSEPMRELFRLIGDVARGDWNVLIEGETGVGKELVAHSIHAASARRDGPFITVNSAGLSESLLASQLFGHRKGAFTGAIKDQEGFFEAASGGTLFLDEIGDLPLGMQASLLRALQEKEITRLGETLARKVDVRILAATHKELSHEVRAGRFREDLLYRLRVARLRVPALRERRADIPLLAEAFLAQSYHLSSRAQPRLGIEAMQCLLNYEWPGNVRELKACVDYAVIHCKGTHITPQDLPPEIGRQPLRATAAPEPPGAITDERGRILAALEKTGGNRQQAARLLGISRATLYRRFSELGISPLR